MSKEALKNKPLVEAIFEIRWALQQKAAGFELDPHYRILLGRLHDKVRDRYPEHEPVEAASVPDEMVGHMVQHRFRAAPGDWPLIQLGPGLFTLNDTYKYKWEDFRARIIDAKNRLYEAHPKTADLRIESVTLRYIDAVEFDYHKENIFDFMSRNLKVTLSMPPELFQEGDVDSLPQHFQSRQTYRCGKPPGVLSLALATGQRSGTAALVWETTVQSTGSDVPPMEKGFEEWIDQAHYLIVDNWFFKMIDGHLHRRFRGE